MSRLGNSSDWVRREIRTAGAILLLAIRKFLRINGTQWAGAFAFNMFFSLFPLMILLVTVTSFFLDRVEARKDAITYLESYVPISGEMQAHLFRAISGVIKARGQAGAVALILLIWVAMQCFITLIGATNRAWNEEDYQWWRQLLKSLVLLGITAGAALLGMAVSVLMRMAKGSIYRIPDLYSLAHGLGSFFLPLLIIFFGLGLFYKFAPGRPTRFTEVWASALLTTILLRSGDSLFVIYLKHFATLNAVYGAFGGIIALLLWIYVSGCIIIFGACLCAGQSDVLKLHRK